MDERNLAVLLQLKQAMEKANPPAIAITEVANPSVPVSKGWILKNCRFCKTTKFRIHTDWVNPPVMCDGCRNERKTKYVSGQGDTLFSNPKVFRGGSPGGGKHK